MKTWLLLKEAWIGGGGPVSPLDALEAASLGMMSVIM